MLLDSKTKQERNGQERNMLVRSVRVAALSVEVGSGSEIRI